MPDLTVICSGTDQHCRTWNDSISVLLIDHSLDPVCTCTEDGDKRIVGRIRTAIIITHTVIQCVSIITSKLAGIDLLDHTIDLAAYLCISGRCLKLVDLCLLTDLIVLILLQVHLIGLNLNSVRKLIILISFFLFLLKGFDLLIEA